MADGQLTAFCRRLRGILSLQGTDHGSDGQLLELFVAKRDEAAFATLVRRHGPMVLGVCQRVLNNRHDAEDAFQASFLVLARRAATLGRREPLANWLYGVARRTALKARTAAARRQRREREAASVPQTDLTLEAMWRDLRPVLDEELGRLPDKYRVPVVLCHLEGKTQEEAAKQLGWPVGTVAGRLARARDVLRRRLVRRGVTLSAVVLATLLSAQTASAQVPAALLTSTVQAAIGAGTVSLSVAALTKGVLTSMFLSKLKSAAIIVAAVGVVSTGAGMMSQGAMLPGAGALGNGKSLFRWTAVDKDDKELIQGTWKVVTAEQAGEKAPDDALKVMRFIITGNKILMKAADDERVIAEFTLNPTAKPKAIDLKPPDEKKTGLGIYQLDANDLKILFSEGEAASRPTSFTTEKGSRQILFVLKRVEPGKDEKVSEEDVQKIKAAAARQMSANNLKQIAIALHNYHDTHNHFPAPAIYSKDGKPLLSWRVAILPYIEQDNLYKQFHLDEAWDSEHNKKLLQVMPRTYAPVLGPAKEPNSTFYRVFVGPGAVFEEKKELRFADITDGSSNTILTVEAGEAVPWTKPDELPFAAGTPIPKLGGQFKDTVTVGFADGSVRFIPAGLGEKLRPFITRNGGEVVDYNDLNPKK